MSEPKADERRCPYCAEVIKRAAIKCRWCGSDVEPAPAVEVRAERASKPEERDEPEGPRLVTSRLASSHLSTGADAPRTSTTGSVFGRPWVSAVLAVLLVAACAGVWLAVKHANDDPVAPDGELSSAAVRAGIMAQATGLTQTAMSYRAAQADADIAAAEKLMTPAMRKKYEADLPPADKRPEQARQRVTIKATVASLSGKNSCTSDDCAVSIVSATADRARVLVFVDQDATAASTKNSVASPQWELLALVKQDGSWLIDDMAAD